MSEVNQETEALVNYYRQRAADLEYQFVQFQVAASKKIEELEAQIAESQSSEE